MLNENWVGSVAKELVGLLCRMYLVLGTLMSSCHSMIVDYHPCYLVLGTPYVIMPHGNRAAERTLVVHM